MGAETRPWTPAAGPARVHTPACTACIHRRSGSLGVPGPTRSGKPGGDHDPHGKAVYRIGLAFTFVGALIFSTIRSRRARIPQEASIGISHALASAAAILAMSKAASGSEHLKDMLVGDIAGVLLGTLVSALGSYLSPALDLPTGATLACTFGAVLILMALVKPLIVRSRR